MSAVVAGILYTPATDTRVESLKKVRLYQSGRAYKSSVSLTTSIGNFSCGRRWLGPSLGFEPPGGEPSHLLESPYLT